MSENRRGRRLRDFASMLGLYRQQPAEQPQAEGMDLPTMPVRTAEAEDAYQLGARMGAQSLAPEGGFQAQQAGPPIGKEQVMKAIETLNKYKQGKATIDRRIIRAQEWWKLRNWEMIQEERGTQGATEQKSATAWLWNSIVGKHADAMDSYPEPVILPRMEEDQAEAKILSEIIPVVLKNNKFGDEYDDAQYQKLQEGTGAYHIGWDKEKLGGLGDISTKKVNLLQLFWEPGIEDIQDSENLFYTKLVDNRKLEQMYPQLEGKLGRAVLIAREYRTDDKVDTSEKSVLVDWYYHRWDNGRKVLHYVQFVGEEILYSTENNGEEQGLYWDGEYPFVLDPLYKVAGSPAGYGYFDIGKDCQTDVDTINQALVQNTVVTSTPRYFIQNDGGVNEDEFANWSLPFVHTNGMLGDNALRQIETAGIQGTALSMMDRKIDELKYITGNTDVNNGGTPSGVTAASAIAALQEQSGRTSKDTNRGAYRAYEQIINMVIERIRQFYDIPRQFRILGPNGQATFVSYSNAKLVDQQLTGGLGLEPGYRKPVFDIEVHAQRETAYTKMSQNELAVQFMNMGVFNPQLVDQVLLMLDMMDFKGKDELQQKIQNMGTMQDALLKVAQIAMALAQKHAEDEPGVAEELVMVIQGLAADAGLPAGNMQPGGAAQPGGPEAELPAEDQGKPSNTNAFVRKARAQVAESTRPS